MNIVERVKKLILQPKQEWQVIDGETHTVQGLYTQYVMILAAIPAVCGFIGLSLVGFGGVFGATYRMPIAFGVAHMVVNYVLSLGMVYVLALIIDALAPNFGSQKSFSQALKVAAFMPTAAWLAGVFTIIPTLSIIGSLLSLYSLYLLYLGLPILMKTPEDKTVPYVVVVLIAAIVMAVVIGAVVALTMPGPVRGF
jgi:Yip1 domain